MKEFTNTLVNIAFNEIGVRETSNNKGERIRTYQTATTLGPGEFPWCAAFTAWCLAQAIKDKTVLSELSRRQIVADLNSAEVWRCKSARAFDWEPWALRKNITVIKNAIAPAKKGDIVVYDFSHIGIVALDQLPNEQTITAIEGNTNIRGFRDGDGVYARTRRADPTVISAYIRIAP